MTDAPTKPTEIDRLVFIFEGESIFWDSQSDSLVTARGTLSHATMLRIIESLHYSWGQSERSFLQLSGFLNA